MNVCGKILSRIVTLALAWLILLLISVPTCAISSSIAPNCSSAQDYLNPNTGRFWNMDSFQGNQSDPLSLHKYLYVQNNPIMGIDPSGHETIKTKLGKALHKELGRRFTSDGKNPDRYSGPSVANILRSRGIPIPDKVENLLPDLVDAGLKEVYEIKPLTAYGLATGFFQAFGYVSLLNELNPGGGWHLGNTWTPPNFVPLSGGGFAFVSPPAGGVIFYELLTVQDVVKRGVRTVRAADQARLQQMVGIASLVSLMGGF